MFVVMVKIVTPGLDPGVHLQGKTMDGRVIGEQRRPSNGCAGHDS
ncbi:hypothetical protein [Bradyrhizobium sp.]|nr:hypothetical protein [Bradyrhizobium sp.]